MTALNPKFKSCAFSKVFSRGLKDIENTSYFSVKVYEKLFNMFTWVYDNKDISNAFVNEPKLEKFFRGLELDMYKGDSPIYSATVLYNRLNKIIDIRGLEMDTIVYRPEENKQQQVGAFVFEDSYNRYLQSGFEFSEEFLLFNFIFHTEAVYESRRLRSVGELMKISKSQMVREDFKYRLATNKLRVNTERIEDREDKNTLIVLQDASYSMNKYLEPLYFIKAFILRAAFDNEFTVTWLEVTDAVKTSNVFTRDEIGTVPSNLYSGRLNYANILCSEELVGRDVVIITDGTDTFNIPKTASFKSLNIISFSPNKNLKNKIKNYGRFFEIQDNES